jgi:hypothetical protein
MASAKAKELKDSLYAKSAFFLSLGFFIPLFNIGLCITSIILASISLRKQLKEPQNYSGFGYAVAALAISITAILLTIIGGVLYYFSGNICNSAVCQVAP